MDYIWNNSFPIISLKISFSKFFVVFDTILLNIYIFFLQQDDKALKFECFIYINFLKRYTLTNILEIIKEYQ